MKSAVGILTFVIVLVSSLGAPVPPSHQRSSSLSAASVSGAVHGELTGFINISISEHSYGWDGGPKFTSTITLTNNAGPFNGQGVPVVLTWPAFLGAPTVTNCAWTQDLPTSGYCDIPGLGAVNSSVSFTATFSLPATGQGIGYVTATEQPNDPGYVPPPAPAVYTSPLHGLILYGPYQDSWLTSTSKIFRLLHVGFLVSPSVAKVGSVVRITPVGLPVGAVVELSWSRGSVHRQRFVNQGPPAYQRSWTVVIPPRDLIGMRSLLAHVVSWSLTTEAQSEQAGHLVLPIPDQIETGVLLVVPDMSQPNSLVGR
jgi:hypothetical protein